MATGGGAGYGCVAGSFYGKTRVIERVGFGFKNRNRLERSTEDKSDAAWWYSLDEILDELDFLTVHRLLTNETENLQNFEHLNRLRFQVVVVNTERGGVIEEEALANLIYGGKVGVGFTGCLCQ